MAKSKPPLGITQACIVSVLREGPQYTKDLILIAKEQLGVASGDQVLMTLKRLHEQGYLRNDKREGKRKHHYVKNARNERAFKKIVDLSLFLIGVSVESTIPCEESRVGGEEEEEKEEEEEENYAENPSIGRVQFKL